VDSTVNGETGMVVSAEQPGVLADCLADLLKRPEAYARLRQNAWTRSRQFLWDQVLPPACDWLEAQAKAKG
jgi:glycosyltransferase involved in cell wall biosynthesis